MPLLIDGHNLIGAGVFDDISLADEDDEAKLVARLRVWKSRYRGKITVIFDRGIPGGRDRVLSGGGVEVVFAADPTQADDLIRKRLRSQHKGLTLVSNDAALLQEAAVFGVERLRGDEFVARFTLHAPSAAEAGSEHDVQLSDAEVDEWLAIFGSRTSRSSRGKPPRRKQKP